MKFKWNNISLGSEASFQTKFEEEDIDEFARISGDDNPLHTDAGFAKSKGFSGKVVHGMLLASCFSRLVGRFFLGDNNLYLSQTLNFKRPVMAGEGILVSGQVVSKSESVKTLEIDTVIKNAKGEVAVSGRAVVKSTEQ